MLRRRTADRSGYREINKPSHNKRESGASGVPPSNKNNEANFHNECTKAETTSRKEGESNELRALIHQQLISCLAYSSCAECHHDESRKEWN